MFGPVHLIGNASLKTHERTALPSGPTSDTVTLIRCAWRWVFQSHFSSASS